MKKIVTIIGPTASGKTNLAIKLAKRCNGEIVGLDSRQIYKGMEIGTAQPTRKEMDGVRHHLIGFRNPSEPISAGEFSSMVSAKINEIQRKNKIAIICGGAGLYFRALSRGIFHGSISNLVIRKNLEKLYDKNPMKLYNRLKSIDPKYCEIVHVNNKKRLIRALEIYETTKKSPSENFKDQKLHGAKNPSLFTILLKWNKHILNDRIFKRTKMMIRDGWVDEVRLLIKKREEGKIDFPSLDSIGYKQIHSYLNGGFTSDELIEKISIKTRQYARKQMQWFNKEVIDLFVEMDNIKNKNIDQILHGLLKTFF